MRKIHSTGPTLPSIDSANVSTTAMKTSWKTRGRVMWFLVRAAFWLSIVIVVLPTPESVKMPASNVGTAQAVSAASATMSDMRQFCVRQPLYEFLSDKLGTQHAAPARVEPKLPADHDLSQNTLTRSDAAPPWRGQADAKR
jgi:hypothetical protein